MKRILTSALVLCMLLSVYPVCAPSEERVIIVFYTTPDVGLVAQYGQVHQTFHLIPAVVATVPYSAVDALSRNSAVKYVHVDARVGVASQKSHVAGKPSRQVLPWGG